MQRKNGPLLKARHRLIRGAASTKEREVVRLFGSGQGVIP